MNVKKVVVSVLFASLLVANGLINLPVFADTEVQPTEVQPTDAEVEYMERLDNHLGETLGGNNSVDSSVTQSDTGQRTIHMDYSNSDGSIITPSSSGSADPGSSSGSADPQ